MSENKEVSIDEQIEIKTKELIKLIEAGYKEDPEAQTHVMIVTGINDGDKGLTGGLTNTFVKGTQLSFLQMLLGTADTEIEIAKIIARAGYMLTNNVEEIHNYIREMSEADAKAAAEKEKSAIEDAEVITEEVKPEAKEKK